MTINKCSKWVEHYFQVNNQKLLGLNHVEVVTILKELPTNVRIVCGRKSLSASFEDQMTTDEDTVKVFYENFYFDY